MADETDEELLARYRAHHGNPYMNLTTARSLHAMNLRYRHLGLAAQQRARLEREAELERIRRKIFGLPNYDTPGDAVAMPISRYPSSKRRL
jgi:hypothetical protein